MSFIKIQVIDTEFKLIYENRDSILINNNSNSFTTLITLKNEIKELCVGYYDVLKEKKSCFL
jgi:hypothetical protein